METREPDIRKSVMGLDSKRLWFNHGRFPFGSCGTISVISGMLLLSTISPHPEDLVNPRGLRRTECLSHKPAPC